MYLKSDRSIYGDNFHSAMYVCGNAYIYISMYIHKYVCLHTYISTIHMHV